MKKAIVTMDYKPDEGGISEYWSHLFSFLPKDQFMLVAPLANIDSDLESVIRIEFFYKKIWPKWLKLFFELKKIIKKFNIYHLVAGQILPVGTVCYLLKKLHYIDSYSLSCHSMDISHLRSHKKLLAKLIFLSANKVIVNSHYTKNLVKKYGYTGTIDIVYPAPQILPAQGIDLSTKYDWLSDQPMLLSVGRLVKRKGVDKVIAALPQIWQQFPTVHYIILGEGQDRDYLTNLIATLPSEQAVKIHLLGQVEVVELVSWYRAADVFVLPSRDIQGDIEGFGMVNIEAATYGLPIIVGQVGGVPETVLNNISGFSIDGNNIELLVDKIIDLLDHPDKLKKMGQIGSDFSKNFSWENSSKILIKSLDVL